MEGKVSLGVLFEKHQVKLKKFIALKFSKSAHEAEDIVQDAFYNMLRIGQDEPLKNSKAYLYKTANNLALNRLRRHRCHDDYVASQDLHQAYELTPERNVLAAKDLMLLTTSLAKISKKYRRTFLLSRVEGKTYREISMDLGIPVSTVEKHIIKTLRYLHVEFNRGCSR